MSDVYVYYRVAVGQAELAGTRIDSLLGAMRSHCGRPPRRLVRCEDASTWMEIYEGVADYAAFSNALDAAARRFECARFTDGPRHLECFIAPDAARE